MSDDDHASNGPPGMSDDEWSGPPLVDLAYLLANLYLMRSDSLAVVLRAELSPANIAFSEKATTNWLNTLLYARARGRVGAVTAAALVDYRDTPALLRARAGAPPRTLHG